MYNREELQRIERKMAANLLAGMVLKAETHEKKKNVLNDFQYFVSVWRFRGGGVENCFNPYQFNDTRLWVAVLFLPMFS